MKLLSAGLNTLNIPMNEADQQKLLEFLALLQKWNRHFNLTAITDLQQMIIYHLLDSLTLVPFIEGDDILDFGTGAGLPGVPLSIYFPHKHWFLLDSNGKKIRFLIHAKAQLKLNNVEIIHERAEKWQTLLKFDCIVVRAVGSMQKIIDDTQHLLKPTGCWLLMKGESTEEKSDNHQWQMKIHRVTVPGISSERQVIIVKSRHM